jgi:ABC-type nitrate/sulfonate/bicarbonate transport system substrate-binding protein
MAFKRSGVRLPLAPPGTFLAALAAVACLAAGTVPAQAETIVFGITSSTALSLPHYIAEDKKFYDAEHLAVETYAVGAAASVLQPLAGGSLDMAQAATDQTLRAIRRGAPIVAGASSSAPFRMPAARTAMDWSGLKGRTVSVGGLTDVTLYFLRVMARRNGLADQDYDLLYGGSSPNRLAQLRDEVIAPEAALYLDGVRANLDAFVAMGELAQVPPLTGFIDTSFLAEALAPGRGPAR